MGRILLILTNLAFPFAALWVLLGFVFSPRRKVLKTLRQELAERFASTPAEQLKQGALWIHCASVGEVKSVAELIKELKNLYHKDILMTTTTAAGKAEAAKNKDIAQVVLAPLDFYPFSRRFIRRANPYRLLIVEREIWPNMIAATQAAGVPVFFINARISQKSARAYGWVRPLFARLFSKVALATVQEPRAVIRYKHLGLPEEKILLCGNIKYDTLSDQPARLSQAQALIKQLGWENDFVLVCGSTHPVEEQLILQALPAWNKQGIKVIFAPRHLERRAEIKALLQKQPLAYGFVSEGNFPPNCAIVCADEMGFLQALYACASLTFVGGSIAPRGAHNLLEPAILKKAVLFGPSFYNTAIPADALLSCGGGILVTPQSLQGTVLRLKKEPAALENMADKARQTALDFKGATQKIIHAIENYERTTA